MPNLFLDYPSPAFPGAPGASNGPCLVCRPRLFASTWSSPPPRSVGWALPGPVPHWCSGHKGRGGQGRAKVEKFLGKSWKRPRNFSEQLKDISNPCKRSLKVWGFESRPVQQASSKPSSKAISGTSHLHTQSHESHIFIHCVMWSSHVVGALFRV